MYANIFVVKWAASHQHDDVISGFVTAVTIVLTKIH